MDISALSIREIAAGVRSTALDPVAIVEYHLARIDARNPALKALRHVDRDGALKTARTLRDEAKRGTVRGRLHGVVFCAKDSIDAAAFPLGDGSVNHADVRSAHDAALIARLTREGAICIGKGNMAEYGKSYFTDNRAFGRSSNPFDESRTPGGSGGGDAAAVAANMASFGIGADAGGSLRVPANFCALFGLFPTNGLLTAAGLGHATNTTSHLFRSFGPLARSLDDLELLLAILAGYDAADPYSVPAPPPRLGRAETGTGRFLHFTEINGAHCDRQTAAALAGAATKLELAGYKGEARTPPEVSACLELFIVLAGQAKLLLEDTLATASGHPRDLSAESDALKTTRRRIAERLPPLTAERVLTVWHRVDMLRHQAARLFEQYDFILAPVAACLPPSHGAQDFKVDAQTLESQQVFQFSSCANTLGLPALAFPTGWSKDGLPVGLQLIGPRFSEGKLCRVVRELGYVKIPQRA